MKLSFPPVVLAACLAFGGCAEVTQKTQTAVAAQISPSPSILETRIIPSSPLFLSNTELLSHLRGAEVNTDDAQNELLNSHFPDRYSKFDK